MLDRGRAYACRTQVGTIARSHPPAHAISLEQSVIAGAAVDPQLEGLVSPASTPGLGDAHTLVGPQVVGSSLSLEDELLALCAFPSSEPRDEVVGGVARPSRRRLR